MLHRLRYLVIRTPSNISEPNQMHTPQPCNQCPNQDTSCDRELRSIEENFSKRLPWSWKNEPSMFLKRKSIL
jgi:hypothetical protein